MAFSSAKPPDLARPDPLRLRWWPPSERKSPPFLCSHPPAVRVTYRFGQPHVSSGCLTPTSRRFRRDGRKSLDVHPAWDGGYRPTGDREIQARCRPPLNTRLTRIVSSTELNCSCGYANARCFGRAITIEAAPQASRHSTPLSRRPPWPASEASSSFFRRGRKSRSLHLQRQKNLSG